MMKIVAFFTQHKNMDPKVRESWTNRATVISPEFITEL